MPVSCAKTSLTLVYAFDPGALAKLTSKHSNCDGMTTLYLSLAYGA